MVDNNKILSQLSELGLSEYEAKAYVSLLRENPLTAYEISKSSGVPTSKIYEVMKKLADKRIVSFIDERKTTRYVPLDPDEFVRRQKDSVMKLFDSLASQLPRLHHASDVSHIWNITDYAYLIEKAQRMISEAGSQLLVSLWKEEYELLEEGLNQAFGRGVKTAIVHFGQRERGPGQLYSHPIEDTLYQEKGGRVLVVIADSGEVLIGTVFSNMITEGAWSSNRGFVMLAEDYIKHDIYITKIVKRLDRTLLKRFGDNYHMLRDIFNDEEAA